MNSLVIAQIEDVRQQLNGYTVLLGYRYMNLCVKAEAASLMPVTVYDEGAEFDIEDVADVSVANDYQLVVYPKYPEQILNIIEGVTEAHPEFKMSVKKGEMTYMSEEEARQYRGTKQGAEPDEMEEFADGDLNGDLNGLFLIYTMPDVDKNRRDLLTAAVKSLHTECMMRIDSIYARNADNILIMLENTPVKEANTLKNELERTYKDYKERADSLRDEKLKEIDDAYARYTRKQSEAQKEASDYGDGLSMNLMNEY